MSIGAYVAALKRKNPSFDVDTQDTLFVDGQTGEGLGQRLENDWSFTPLLSSLSVDAVAVANGCPRVMGAKTGDRSFPWQSIFSTAIKPCMSPASRGAKSRLLPLLDEVHARARPLVALSGTSGDVRMLERTVG